MANEGRQADRLRMAKLLLAGGLSGAFARTCTAPLDRIKLLFQVQALGQAGTQAGMYTGIGQAFGRIYTEEGVRAFWKGNGTNIIRIFPYSAGQFMAHEQVKAFIAESSWGPQGGALSVTQRLTAGACAGMFATALTHPLDTLRLRLALPSHGYNGAVHAMSTILRKEGLLALYKGLSPTLVGIAPYAALNFASYDMLKTAVYARQPSARQSTVTNLLLGATAGTVATTVCYPLDTIRRRMQMKGTVYRSSLHAVGTMIRTEGVRSFYNGWLANTIKVVPQNSLRFVAFEFFKKMFGVHRKRTDT